MDVISAEDPRAAYDCVLSRHWSTADSHLKNDAWESYQTYASRFRASESILNISAAEDLEACQDERIQDYLARYGTTQVIHGRQFSRSLYGFIDQEWISPGTMRLTAIAQKGETNAPAFNPDAPTPYVLMPETKARKIDETRFQLSGTPAGDSRLLFIFDTRVETEDAFSFTVSLTASAACKVSLALCRHGRSDYEGSAATFDLVEGVNTLTVEHVFASNHARLRGQITVSEGDTEIAINDVVLDLGHSWWPEGYEEFLEDDDAVKPAAE